MDECINCIHNEACKHLIDTDKEELAVCEHFKPNTNTATTKRGIWRKHDMGFAAEYKCSLCGYTYCEADPTYPPEKYCCKCGAENG